MQACGFTELEGLEVSPLAAAEAGDATEEEAETVEED